VLPASWSFPEPTLIRSLLGPPCALVEARDTVSRCMRALTERESNVLYMRFYEDFTQKEIAERIGVSQMQVSRIIRRALEFSRPLAQV